MAMFKQATRHKLKLRMALDGPSGSGKSYTALRFAFAIAGPSGRVAVIDTEHRSASKYKGESPDGIPWNFDVCELEHYSPAAYTAATNEAGVQGYDVLVIDSLSHGWEGVGGALDQVDRAADKSGNKFTAWRDVTPQHRQMVEAILACKCHVIVTMRSKMEYVLEADEKGKMVPKKVGMAPIQRAGVEYEFDVVADLNLDHLLVVSKSRCSAIDGLRVMKPDANFITPVIRWLETGEAVVEAVVAEKPAFTGETTQLLASSEPPPGQFCDSEQQRQICALASQLGMPSEAMQAAVAKRGAYNLAGLTWAQADEMIENMRRLSSERQAAQVF